MKEEERKIRELVTAWMDATKSGDVEKVLSLMAEDAIFLVTGQPPMTKADFANAARAQTGAEAPNFDGTSDIQEIKVLGDWAYMWQKLTVVGTPPNGGPQVRRSGHTMTIFKKESGAWVLARDANMLAPVEE